MKLLSPFRESVAVFSVSLDYPGDPGVTPIVSNVTTTGTAAAGFLPKLGQISFINCLPIVLPIEKGHIGLEAQIVYANPSQLNEKYTKGALELGAMSSFYYLENKRLELLPQLSISSDGPVGSVLFFSKVSTHLLNGARVAVPSSSATSVNLLKILLLEQLNVRPNFVIENEPDLRDERTDAALVIGDRALAVDNAWSSRYWRADLGQWWQMQTGLPMVFGVWAARTEWVNSNGNRAQFDRIAETLRASCKLGLTELFPLVLNEATSRSGLSPNRISRYFHKELNFQLTDRHLQGLDQFWRLCKQYRLLEETAGSVG
jgi:chorismate dehydratase